MTTPDGSELLRKMRSGALLTQARMAELMGVPLRTYEDLEAGRSTVRKIHANAALFALIQNAADGRGAADLPSDLNDLTKRACRPSVSAN